ncbi:BREX-1 system phosphatase PglZ type A [Enorma burkinafasonensis]|uniref:BREX-1 system phosphatase PglZ type A n=1 Tax=Enorma burkinafasonensis TaxID=2590867 RepID=UPI00119CDA51|nr:BREX-1 system phosphatase PglZ type A [Enorma burkinafasonensis]
MRTTDIQTELRRRFDETDAPTASAIVIWHDPDGEFADTLEGLELPDIEVIREEPGRRFALKRELNGDLTGRQILLYRRRQRNLVGDWLADVEARAQAFSADYLSVQMRELNAADTPEMRNAFSAHKAFLAKKTNLKKLARLIDAYQVPQQLELAIMACALGTQEATATQVLIAYLVKAAGEGAPAAFGALEQAGVADAFTRALASWTGFAGDARDLTALAQHVLLSALAPTVPAGALDRLGSCHSSEHAPFCHSLVNEWGRSDLSDELLELCCTVEEATDLEAVLGRFDAPELSRAEVFPCIDALILRRLFRTVAAGPDGADAAMELAAGRRGSLWSGRFSCYYEGIICAARMQIFCRERGPELGAMTAEVLWKRYTAEYWHMDRWYRELHVAFAQAVRAGEYGLDEDFRSCCTALEDLYKGWFLKELSRRWASAVEGDLARTGYVNGIPRQLDFYLDEVEPVLRTKKRAWVVVSDALRFEVAAELAEHLERETKGNCDLGAAQAVFPSITKCGMSALLPSTSFAYAATSSAERRRLSVLTDGSEALSTEGRQAQIRKHASASVAVRYDDFVNEMGRAERRALVGDAEVVYLYHNTIDALGDKEPTERKVFTACGEAIEELAACIQLIVREFGASSVIATADHGFLYTDRPLAESEHASVADIAGTVVEAGRRYAVTEGDADGGPLVRVALPCAADAEPLTGFAPRECVRLRMAGGGENYVHGGISLQELCVPVLRFANKRAGSKGYMESAPAGISLVTRIDTVTNSLFTLEFLQDEPVGGKVLPAEYEVFVGDAAHEPVTDIARVVADRIEADATARKLHVSLSLKPGAGTSERELYRLYARNTKTREVRALCDLRIHVAFAPSIDFGW